MKFIFYNVIILIFIGIFLFLDDLVYYLENGFDGSELEDDVLGKDLGRKMCFLFFLKLYLVSCG